ncbi:MAG: (2Fe-2S)-binding protein [Xanthomonadales bacterium]|nr:(2Fe-2S)-binding protein [Xanthomonadales bacterium]
MYVCICNSVTDKEIRRAAERGVDSMRQLRETTGCAGTCGQCAQLASQILQEAQPNRSARELPLDVTPIFA